MSYEYCDNPLNRDDESYVSVNYDGTEKNIKPSTTIFGPTAVTIDKWRFIKGEKNNDNK